MTDPEDIFEKQKQILEKAHEEFQSKSENDELPEIDTLKLSESILNLTELSDFGRQISAASRFCVLNGRNDLAVELLKLYIDEFDRIFEGYYTGVQDKEFIEAIAHRYGLSDPTN